MGRCMRCGRCCTRFGVCLTPADIGRISRATGLATSAFVQAIPDHEDRERKEPSVLIDGERCLIVLRWRAKRICMFYTGGGCSIYAHRPILCRTYPFIRVGCALKDLGSRQCPVRWAAGPDGYLKDIEAYERDIEEYRVIAKTWNEGPGGGLETVLSFLKRGYKAKDC
ncbi:MAG: YkgJ family cysteine cluster protein [Candidatus Micrarchaeota archaeon]